MSSRRVGVAVGFDGPGLPGESLATRMRRYGEAVADAAEVRRREAVGATSFVQYALTHEPMRAMLEGANEQIYREAASKLLQAVPRQSCRCAPMNSCAWYMPWLMD